MSEGKASVSRSLFVVLLATIAITSCQRKTVADQSSRVASLEAENSALRALLKQVQNQTQPARQLPPAREPVPVPASALPARNNDDVAVIEGLRKSLAEVYVANGELNTRITTLDARIVSLQTERQNAAAIQSATLEELSIARRETEASQRDTLAKDARIAQLEVQMRKLRDEAGANAKQAALLTQLAADLQDIFRRRETYISNILSRYKEITEQYRVVALDHGTNVARIQQALSMADEDMRQLNSLNARALLIQRKLNK